MKKKRIKNRVNLWKVLLIMKKPEIPDLRAEWERIRHIIEERNRKYGALTEEDVKKEVEAYRR